MTLMKRFLCLAPLWAVGLAVAQPCEVPSPGPSRTSTKALPVAEVPAVRLRLELRDSLPSGRADSVVSTRVGAGRPVLTLWTDNNQAVEARMNLPEPTPQASLQWVWSAQQGVAVTPAPATSGQTLQARWWFCPTWPGGMALVRVRYDTPAMDAGAFSAARPALSGQISVPLDEWVPLWAPQTEPAKSGGDSVVRSTHAAALPRLDMRWRRE